MQMVSSFRQQILSGQASFHDLASKESHCSSAKRGGDLGEFGRGQMQAPFEKATYALKAIPTDADFMCVNASLLILVYSTIQKTVFCRVKTKAERHAPMRCVLVLQVGEISEPVVTDSGVHIIKRTG